jgi:alpha-amylase
MKSSKKIKLLCLTMAAALAISGAGFVAWQNLGKAQAGSANEGASTFSWDNATVYFLLTDRFNNGDTSNDHSY